MINKESMKNYKKNSEIKEMIDKESTENYNENYEILGLIGKGSYGCIYKGIDKKKGNWGQ